MISPWKCGWLNPNTMSCTGPIAMMAPLLRRKPAPSRTHPAADLNLPRPGLVRAACLQYRLSARCGTPPRWDEKRRPGYLGCDARMVTSDLSEAGVVRSRAASRARDQALLDRNGPRLDFLDG